MRETWLSGIREWGTPTRLPARGRRGQRAEPTSRRAIRAGARGYQLKGAAQQETLRAIRSVANGEAIFGPAIAQRLINFFAAPRQASLPVFPELTSREFETLELISQGKNNAEIAGRLSLSQKTVRNNVSTILNKLHVADRAAAIVRAREAGLGQDPV
jgi:DNA-binding NarL/FixJ family response regulator